VGFDLTDALSPGDLLIPLPETPDAWSAPLPGLPPLPPIQSVFVNAPPLEGLFGGAADDIGTEPAPELADPTAQPDRESAGERVSRLAAQAARPFLWMAKKLLGVVPWVAPRRTMWNDLEDWVDEKLGAASDRLSSARERALKKLLEELEKDPDQGLKHALPLASAGLHRGIAPPSSQLGSRDPNFDLGRVGGGRSLDAWDVSSNYQQELRRHYMELANREVQLGRHRRAAYIYAELLGDLSTAAIVLKNGGHAAEAALLYRDHLHRPLEAAGCFVEAGQYLEAVKLYEEGKRWDRLAALYRRMEDAEKAAAAFEIWIQELLRSDDPRQAAEILRNELKDRKRALEILEGAWPSSRQAVACIETALTLRAETGEHEESIRLVKSLVKSTGADRLHHLLALFGSVQKTYPDRRIRSLAEDLGRREIARLLPTVPDGQRSRLIRHLTALSPEDTLLSRDGLRHLDTKAKAAAKGTTMVPLGAAERGVVGKIALETVFTHPLPEGLSLSQLRGAAAGSDTVCLVGYHRQKAELVAFLGTPASSKPFFTRLHWALSPSVWASTPVPLLATTRHDSGYLLHLPAAPAALHAQEVPGTGNGRGRLAMKTGSPSWLADPIWAAAYDADGLMWVLRMTRVGWRLSQFSTTGTLTADRTLPVLDDEPVPENPFPMAVTNRHLVLAVRDRVLIFDFSDAASLEPEELVFSGPVTGLVQPPVWSSPRVAVATQETVSLLYLGGDRPHIVPVSDDLTAPGMAFGQDGALHVVSGSVGQVIYADRTRAHRRWQFDLPRPVLALLPGGELWSFVTVDEDWTVRQWRYEGRHLNQTSSAT
jgi:tetratricopeptide (TPR) repeat protein